MMDHLLHLDRSTDVDSLLAFVELLFQSIIRLKPVASGLSGRATSASVCATGANVVNGRTKSWQGTILRTETENERGRNMRTEETMEFRDFLPPAATVFFWGTMM
jgi:hypothetical protein